MPEHNEQMEQHAQITFERSLGLFDAVMLGLGVMLGAGIFVLIGVACGLAGPAAVFVFAGNAGLSFFTALSYMELSSAIPEAGGGYSYIRRAFPLGIAFVAGWTLWFALIVSSALFAIGFGNFLWKMLMMYQPALVSAIDMLFSGWPGGPSMIAALLVVLLFAALNYRGAEVTGKAENWLTLGKLFTILVFLGFGSHFAFSRPEAALASFAPMFPNGGAPVLAAMALSFIAFGGYDLICSIAEEVHEPRRTIPRAIFISWLISSMGRVLVVLVALAAIPVTDGLPSWQFLGEQGKIGLLAASGAFLSPFWAGVVACGGLLATTGALNASVLAASRVSFSMSRDSLLWRGLSAVHRRNRTPYAAIIATTAMILVLIVVLPLETVGSASSLMFLTIFALVNLSLILLRRRREHEPRFRVPLFPLTPVLGVLSCIGLAAGQLMLGSSGLVSLGLGTGWLLLGAVLYRLYFRAAAHMTLPQVLRPYPEQVSGLRSVRYRVMVQVYNPASVETLVRIGCRAAAAHGSDTEVVVNYVIELPVQSDLREGLKQVTQAETLLQPAYGVARDCGVALRTEIRIAHDAAHAITTLARAERVNLLVIGWRGFSMRREAVLGGVVDDVLTQAPCDVLVVRTRPAFEPHFERILIATAGGPSARLAARLAAGLLEPQGEVTVLGIAAGSVDSESRSRARDAVSQTIAELPASVRALRRLIAGRHIAATVLKEARKGYDVLMVGATGHSWFSRVLLGEMPARIAKESPIPVLLVRQDGRRHSWLSRLLGR